MCHQGAMIAKAIFVLQMVQGPRPLAPCGCGALVYHCTLRFLLLYASVKLGRNIGN